MVSICDDGLNVDLDCLLGHLAPETVRPLSLAEHERAVAMGVLDGRSTPDSVWPLTRSAYEHMVDIGLFDDERVELLQGVLVRMSPMGPFHSEVVDRLNEWLMPLLRGRARVRIQGPFAASDYSEPEPDIGVYPVGNYSRAHPTRALLLIEVAQSSLNKDRNIKTGIYAAAGCPEYWIVNLHTREVEIHTHPVKSKTGVEYAETRRAGARDTVAPIEFPDVELSVAWLFALIA